MLSIESDALYDDIVTGMEFHSHLPYASDTFKPNDEIRIPINNQDLITAPFESTLHISGKVTGKNGATDTDVYLVNNAIAFLFEDMRYEIGGIEVDRVKNVGVTSTLKNLLTVRRGEENPLKNACWFGPGQNLKIGSDGVFTFSVPLRLLLGFAEDYKKIIINVNQELILLRSASHLNAITAASGSTCQLEITRLYWRVPHITVSDEYNMKLLGIVERDIPIHLPFRSWELHEFPTLPATQRQLWTVKTSSQLEKPRYVILAFHTDRKNKVDKDMSTFDACKLMEVKLYLNSQCFPYNNIRGDWVIFYEMYANFQKSFYGTNNSPIMDFETFKNKAPVYVIDCSKQNDTIKQGPVDVRLEFEASENFPNNTSAYVLLIHDSHVTYTPLTGTVKRISP